MTGCKINTIGALHFRRGSKFKGKSGCFGLFRGVYPTKFQMEPYTLAHADYFFMCFSLFIAYFEGHHCNLRAPNSMDTQIFFVPSTQNAYHRHCVVGWIVICEIFFPLKNSVVGFLPLGISVKKHIFSHSYLDFMVREIAL